MYGKNIHIIYRNEANFYRVIETLVTLVLKLQDHF